MKAAYPALLIAALLTISATCNSWAGDTTRAVEPPKALAKVEGGSTVAFVTGAEAEPPAMPDGTPMPEPRKASSIMKPSAKKAQQPAAAKEAKFATPETVKKHPPIQPVSAKAVRQEELAKPAHAAVRWND